MVDVVLWPPPELQQAPSFHVSDLHFVLGAQTHQGFAVMNER